MEGRQNRNSMKDDQSPAGVHENAPAAFNGGNAAAIIA
jgi:hypothetical protein